MLSWQQTEFLLKGVYLGLLVMIAWLVPDAEELAFIGLGTVGGLALFLGVAAVRKYREGFRLRGSWLGYLAFMLLENPGMVYAGLLVGLTTGTGLTFNHFRGENAIPLESLWPVLGGARSRRHLLRPPPRSPAPATAFWISLALALLLIGGAMAFYYYNPTALSDQQRGMIGLLLLLGIPGFFLLTFAGLVEESEIEIAAMCAALGIGTWTLSRRLRPPRRRRPRRSLARRHFFIYTTRILPGLRVFKHALRGMSYRRMGQDPARPVLAGAGAATGAEQRHGPAQMWDLHRDLDFGSLQTQPDLVPFLHFDFCLERISQILQTKPNPRRAGARSSRCSI